MCDRELTQLRADLARERERAELAGEAGDAAIAYSEGIAKGRDAWKKAAEKLRQERNGWKESAAHFAKGMEFYRDEIVAKVGDMFGAAARTSDDGSVQDSVLALKVPELVAATIAENDTLHARLERVTAALREARELAQDDLPDDWKTCCWRWHCFRLRIDAALADAEKEGT